MAPTEEQDDPLPDAEDLLAIAALTQDDLLAIDRALLSFSEPQWRKVAYIVSMAMDAYPDLYHDIPDVFYGERIRQLILSGQLESQWTAQTFLDTPGAIIHGNEGDVYEQHAVHG